jgi:hypothetical protein
MGKIVVSNIVQNKIEDLERFLVDELKLSEEAALKRSQRMRDFVASLVIPTGYPLCRFQQWSLLGYRCAVFEKTWIFVYEIFDDGIIVHDMSHTAILTEIIKS